jgi:hypothetical protein
MSLRSLLGVRSNIVQIFAKDVCDAVNKINYNKNDGCNDLSTNHLYFAGIRTTSPLLNFGLGLSVTAPQICALYS